MTAKRLDVKDRLVVKGADGEDLEFCVMALLEDEEDGAAYAVLLHEPENEDEEETFIVTDPYGTLLEDDALAQEVLDDYLAAVDESSEDAQE